MNNILIEQNLILREADWVPAENIEEYFIKIYRIDVPKLYLGDKDECEVWQIRFFNPIDRITRTYIHYMKIVGRGYRTVKKYELILP